MMVNLPAEEWAAVLNCLQSFKAGLEPPNVDKINALTLAIAAQLPREVLADWKIHPHDLLGL